MIYWVRSGDVGPCKVGYAAANIPGRVAMLQVGNPLPLVLLRTEAGDTHLEAALHKYYRAKHVRGEWFLLDEGDVNVCLSTVPLPARRAPLDAGIMAAIKAAGSAAALARSLNVVPTTITQWRRIPAERARAVAEATEVPLHVLRPDLWAAPATAA